MAAPDRTTPTLKLEPTALAEVVLPSGTLADTLAFFVETLGFRIETIFPAESPDVASLSGYGIRLRLAPEAREPGEIRLLCDAPPGTTGRVLVAPNGTKVSLLERDRPVEIPRLRPAFSLVRLQDGEAGVGRAGMIYRDLIPDRQGGRFIASHITLPEGGPVADWVHFHKLRLQLLFCRRGWARLVYEDQGPAFLMTEGDCVLQPPQIRHRVLETSPGFEVVEIACPALHETLADHDMALPSGRHLPDRDFGGQTFLHGRVANSPWIPHRDGGFQRRDSGVLRASAGLGDAYVLRPAGSRSLDEPGQPGELLFSFVLDGGAVLVFEGEHPICGGDAFVIPPGEAWALRESSSDLALLQVVAYPAAGSARAD